ncbi:MAG: hypothetical protein HUU50_02515 [Candidatus Brocadiae bacterium]|nr:hypothetical protein [Candidatus Brocadiia bacterium]
MEEISTRDFLFSVCVSPNNTRTLTVFEDGESCSIDLSQEMAKTLADLLAGKPDMADKELLAEIASGIKKTNEHLEADLKIKLGLLSSHSKPPEKNPAQIRILNGLDSKQMEQYFEKTSEAYRHELGNIFFL